MPQWVHFFSGRAGLEMSALCSSICTAHVHLWMSSLLSLLQTGSWAASAQQLAQLSHINKLLLLPPLLLPLPLASLCPAIAQTKEWSLSLLALTCRAATRLSPGQADRSAPHSRTCAANSSTTSRCTAPAGESDRQILKHTANKVRLKHGRGLGHISRIA